MRFPNINAIVYFEAVARHSSVNLAAAELLVSRSAVSQQIKTLEQRMGVALFRRVRRRLVLTEEGERLFNAADKALALLRETRDNISLVRDYRSLTIRASSSFGVRWLSPRLADFVAAHPHLDLRIDATSELSDFEKENIDVDIRYTVDMPQGLHCQALVTDHVLPLCAPKLAARAKRAGQDGAAHVLSRARLIHTVKADIKWREWLELHGMDAAPASHGLYFDRSSMSLKAAEDELGVALETATLAMNELRAGRLLPLAPKLGALAIQSYYLVCPVKHLSNRYVKAFIAWLEQKAKTHEAEKRTLLKSLGVKVRPFQRDRRGAAAPPRRRVSHTP